MNNYKKSFKYKKFVNYKKDITYYNYNKKDYYINKYRKSKKNNNLNNILINSIDNIRANAIKAKKKEKPDLKNRLN